MGQEKRGGGSGLFLPLSADEQDAVEKKIQEESPGMSNGKFARTALFFYIHTLEKNGPHAVISEILGA